MHYPIEFVNWQEQQQTLRFIRQCVFIDEQQVSAEEEWDNQDLNAWHFLIYSNNQAIGCARVIQEKRAAATAFHIGRVAVLKPFRGQGAGSALMRALINTCLERQPGALLYLHAQTAVTGFYRQLGFGAEGEVFMDAGIPHIAMTWHE